MTEKIGDQIKIILEKIQNIEEKLNNDLNEMQQTNEKLKENIDNYKQLNDKQIKELGELKHKLEESEKHKCITIEELEKYFIKNKDFRQPVAATSIIRVGR